MTEIFDLIAGTDTGAIIAGSIAKNKPDSDESRNLVKPSLDFFADNGEDYYKSRTLGAWW